MLSLSLHHVAGHVGNITGEILSTINSLSPFWLTLQHSSPLAGHSTSALADSDGGCFGIKKQVVVVTGVGLDSLSLGGYLRLCYASAIIQETQQMFAQSVQ